MKRVLLVTVAFLSRGHPRGRRCHVGECRSAREGRGVPVPHFGGREGPVERRGFRVDLQFGEEVGRETRRGAARQVGCEGELHRRAEGLHLQWGRGPHGPCHGGCLLQGHRGASDIGLPVVRLSVAAIVARSLVSASRFGWFGRRRHSSDYWVY